MPTTFYFKAIPIIVGNLATVSIFAEATGEYSTVILDDQEGDTHDVSADPEGSTPAEKALLGTKAFVAMIAGRRGLSVEPGDVTMVEAP